jgi:hypothetical protein
LLLLIFIFLLWFFLPNFDVIKGSLSNFVIVYLLYYRIGIVCIFCWLVILVKTILNSLRKCWYSVCLGYLRSRLEFWELRIFLLSMSYGEKWFFCQYCIWLQVIFHFRFMSITRIVAIRFFFLCQICSGLLVIQWLSITSCYSRLS